MNDKDIRLYNTYYSNINLHISRLSRVSYMWKALGTAAITTMLTLILTINFSTSISFWLVVSLLVVLIFSLWYLDYKLIYSEKLLREDIKIKTKNLEKISVYDLMTINFSEIDKHHKINKLKLSFSCSLSLWWVFQLITLFFSLILFYN